MNTFTYQSLQTNPTDQDIQNFKTDNPMAPATANNILTITEYVVAVIFVLIGLSLLAGSLVLGLIIIGVGLLILIAPISEQKKNKNLLMGSTKQALFAKENGLSYERYTTYPEGIDMQDKKYTGAVFHLGFTSWIQDRITDDVTGFETGNYQAMRLPGNNATGMYRYGYVSIPITKSVASRVVLDDAHHTLDIFNRLSLGTGVGSVKAQEFGTRRQLTPAFGNDYDLFVNDDAKLDALSILTPELLTVLRQGGTRWYAEIIQNKLYIYKRYNFKAGDEDTLKKIQAILTQATSGGTAGEMITVTGDDVSTQLVKRSHTSTIKLLAIYGGMALGFFILWLVFVANR